jgi:phytanoyl-CoA dioxygenase PhyH
MCVRESSVVERLNEEGFAVVESVFDSAECDRLTRELEAALVVCNDERVVLRRANGAIFGARNLLTVFPQTTMLWRKQPLIDVLVKVLGGQFGLVRGLYFDKPPEGTWSLPWHQDRTSASVLNAVTSPRRDSNPCGVFHAPPYLPPAVRWTMCLTS